jgi:hypothetical protein
LSLNIHSYLSQIVEKYTDYENRQTDNRYEVSTYHCDIVYIKKTEDDLNKKTYFSTISNLRLRFPIQFIEVRIISHASGITISVIFNSTSYFWDIRWSHFSPQLTEMLPVSWPFHSKTANLKYNKELYA